MELESYLAKIIDRAMARSEFEQFSVSNIISPTSKFRRRRALRSAALRSKLRPLIVRAVRLTFARSGDDDGGDILSNLLRILPGGSELVPLAGRPIDAALGVTQSLISLASEVASIPPYIEPAVAVEVALRKRAKKPSLPKPRRPVPPPRPPKPIGNYPNFSGTAPDIVSIDEPTPDGSWQRGSNNIIILFACNREREPA